MSEILDQLRNDHHQFDKGVLSDHVGSEPFTLFHTWLADANKSEPEPNAMVIATVSESGQPSTRVCYLKELDGQAFVFYTNYESRKGRDIEQNPSICLHFFWAGLQRQVIIRGLASKVSDAVSDAYFATRPRSSQLGAWASRQSQELESREELLNRVEELERQFPDEVARPPFWGGYRVEPQEIEFWQGRPSRLHDRIVFRLEQEHWKIFRRNP